MFQAKVPARKFKAYETKAQLALEETRRPVEAQGMA